MAPHLDKGDAGSYTARPLKKEKPLHPQALDNLEIKSAAVVPAPAKDLEGKAAKADSDTLLVHQLFEQQVSKTPEATAVIYEGRSLNYRKLNQLSDALSCRLQAAGVGPGALVAILSERSPEMVIGMLAILKAGGAYLPLHSEYPTAGLAVILEDAKPAALLVQGQLQAKLHSSLQLPILR